MFVHTEKRLGKWGKVEIKLQNIFYGLEKT